MDGMHKPCGFHTTAYVDVKEERREGGEGLGPGLEAGGWSLNLEGTLEASCVSESAGTVSDSVPLTPTRLHINKTHCSVLTVFFFFFFFLP